VAFLVSDVTARVRQICPGFYPDADPYALAFVNEVQVDIALECALFSFETVDISVVNGTRDYSVDPTIYQLSSAIYYQTSTSRWPLQVSSLNEMENRYPAWQADQVGSPFKIFFNGNTVGLYQTPDTTTVSGYPLVRLTVRKAHQFAALSDTLPVQTPRIDAWAYPVAARWCADHEVDRLPEMMALARGALQDLKSFGLRRAMRLNPSVKPQFRIPRNI